MIESSGKLSPGKIALFIHTGRFGAAMKAGWLRVGEPNTGPPFLSYKPNGEVMMLPWVSEELLQAVVDEFRQAMVLDDLANL